MRVTGLWKLILIFLIILPIVCLAARSGRAKDAKASDDNADLDLALVYEKANDYKTAAGFFASAAKDENVRKQALGGLQRVEDRIQAEKARQDQQALNLGEMYMSQRLWSKAEDSFKTAVSSDTKSIQTRAQTRLEDAARESAPTTLSEAVETVKSGAEILAILVGAILVIVYSIALWKKRSSIHINPFQGPSDDVAKKLAYALSYARALLQDPTASPGYALPLTLARGLPTFEDDLPELEDLEVAGAKLPLTALGRIFGKPATTVSAGYDAETPVGSAYALIRNRKKAKPDLHRWTVRANSQSDLMDFAYNVLIEAVTAHAG